MPCLNFHTRLNSEVKMHIFYHFKGSKARAGLSAMHCCPIKQTCARPGGSFIKCL